MPKTVHALFVLTLIASALPAQAQPGWGESRWGRSTMIDRSSPRLNDGPVAHEGRIDTEQFVSGDAAADLGQGAVTATTRMSSTTGDSDPATYEAAVIDQLVQAGYKTSGPTTEEGQIAEIRVLRDVVVPAEGKRKPVSGEMTVGVSNRGSMVGMALAVDLSKAKTALISTRLQAQIRDRATGKPLWEGHATVLTREGDDDWTEQAIATRLASALFAEFPTLSAGGRAAR